MTGTFDYGGGETQMVRLAHELAQRGNEVRIFVLEGGGPLAARCDELGIAWESWDFTGFIPRHPLATARSVVRAGRSLRRFRPDVVHGHLTNAYVLSMPLAWLLRVPVRVSGRLVKGEGSDYRRWSGHQLHHLSRLASNAFIPNAQGVADDVLDVEHVDPVKVHIIENGVDIPDAAADVARSDPVGFVVANLRAQKNHENLFAALALLDDPPQVHLVGEGPERERLERTVAELDLGDIVTFEGFVPDAAGRFADAQFSVLPSHNEGLPNAVLESMAYGVPVIATAVAGVPELIDDDVDGLL
ncbi:MAG TPA: glycosyltransferase, partial [Acidimicrobiales bacterium]